MIRYIKLKESLFTFLILTPFFTSYIYLLLQGIIHSQNLVTYISASLLNVIIYLPIIIVGRNYRATYIIIFIIQSIFSTIELFYLNTYKTLITKSTFFIIFETNISESFEYLSYYYLDNKSIGLYLLTLLIIAIFLARRLKSIRTSLVFKNYSAICIILLFTFVMIGKDKITEHNILINSAKSFIEYKNELKKLKQLADKRTDEIEQTKISKVYQGNETYVLILGESTSRNHLSLYNYHRNTNPKLQEIQNQLFIFKDVISPHSHSLPALSKILTFANYENKKNYYDKGSLIQYINKAGFQTYWISNQAPIGIWDIGTTTLAKSSDKLVFVNYGKHHRKKSLDEKVIIPVKKALSDKHPKKFIVVHLIGTHMDYCKRFPVEYKVFKNKHDNYRNKIVNCYDNAVIYNDYIVHEIIGLVNKTYSTSFVLYFSDHGEEVYDLVDFKGHTEDNGTRNMFEIPFILWVSEKYRDFNKYKVSKFNNYLERKYMTDDVIYSVLDLMNIDFNSNDLSRSIFSQNFQFRKRLIGNVDYDNDLVNIKNIFDFKKTIFDRQTQEFKQKVWAHRVNSIGKLKQAVSIFHGIELDLVFNLENSSFDVNHPPAASIGLTLENYFSSFKNPSLFSFWLDIKNLNDKNYKNALNKISYLAKKYGLIRNNLIIESTNPLLLTEFKKEGFFTCYYLPTEFLNKIKAKNYQNLTEAELNKIESIKRKINKSGIDSVSSKKDNYSFVKNYLKEVKNILLWDTKLQHHRYKDRQLIYEMLGKDERIKVFLVKFKSEYDR